MSFNGQKKSLSLDDLGPPILGNMLEEMLVKQWADLESSEGGPTGRR